MNGMLQIVETLRVSDFLKKVFPINLLNSNESTVHFNVSTISLQLLPCLPRVTVWSRTVLRPQETHATLSCVAELVKRLDFPSFQQS